MASMEQFTRGKRSPGRGSASAFLRAVQAKGLKAKDLAARWGVTQRQMSNISKDPKQIHWDALAGIPTDVCILKICKPCVDQYESLIIKNFKPRPGKCACCGEDMEVGL